MEYSTNLEISESIIIKQFKETVSSHIIERFELRTLHSAHPMLLMAILDPRFENLTLSKYTDSEQRELKLSIVELMEMYREFENLTLSKYTDSEQRELKLSIVELMEMYREFEEMSQMCKMWILLLNTFKKIQCTR